MVLFIHAVVHLGLSQHTYEVKENNGSVEVCFELMDGALTGRPIVLKAYSSDRSAVGKHAIISFSSVSI